MAGQRIQSLDRGLQILKFIAQQNQPVRLAELAELLGVEKSSAHRLVSTLADRGYVRQDSETLGYGFMRRLRARWLRIGVYMNMPASISGSWRRRLAKRLTLRRQATRALCWWITNSAVIP